MEKNKTYLDKLMAEKDFREEFEQEYQNLCVAEQITQARHHAHLTQSALAKRIHTTKSAISRYENANYDKYGIALLTRIAKACEADLKIIFVTSKNAKNDSRFATAL